MKISPNIILTPVLSRSLAVGTVILLAAAAANSGRAESSYMTRDRKEKNRVVKMRFQEAESRVDQPQKWQVIFRGVSQAFTPIEENGGFEKENSLRFYVQYSAGELLRLDTTKLDRTAEDAGIGTYPVYLPDGIGVFVLKKSPGNSELIARLTPGKRITVLGTTRLASYDSAGRILTGIIHVAEEIIPGWDKEISDPEENRMVDNLEIEITAPLRGP